MKRINIVLIIFSIMLSLTASFVSAGTPHTVWGIVNNAADGTPADGSTVTAYIEGRSGETLTDTVGVAGNSGTLNAWAVDTGNFPTAWSIGENLIVEVDNGAGYIADTSVILNSAGSQQAPDTTLAPIPVYGVDLIPDSQGGSADPNADAVYTITINNTGNTADTYTLSTTSGVLSTNPISLNPTETTTFTLTYTVPAGALAGQEFISSVTATSDNDAVKTETVTLTTTANAVYGIDASPNSQSGNVDPGSSKIYTINVANTGNIADTYIISTTEGVLSTNTVSLAYGASQDITLTVSAPGGTAAGTTYNYDVTATSDNDGTKTETVSTTTTVNAAYGVDLSPNSQSGNANPNADAVHTITITNTGNAADTFTVSSTAGVLSTNSVILNAGASADFTLTYTVPAEATAGQEFNADVTATSDNDTTKTETVATTTAANAVYGVDASPNSQSANVDPGASSVYTITIQNTGNTADTYTLSSTGGTLSQNSVNIAYGQTADVTLTVDVPAGTTAGIVYNYDVTVVSDNDLTKTETISTSTTVNAAYNVDLAPNSQSGNVNPGASADYTLTITNTGNIADTYTMSSADGTFNQTVISLDIGASAEVVFTVSVPAEAMAGDNFEDSATVTSDNDASKTETITTTTTANAVYGVNVSPDTQTGNADPSSDYVYDIVIGSSGNAVDTYTISSTGGVLNQTSVSINAGGSATVTLTVTVPADALSGQEFAYGITATSDNDVTKTETVTTTTTANAFANGEITSFTSVPTITLGDSPDFTINFNNTGNYDFNATAYVDVKDASNTLVGTLSGSATAVAVGVTESLTVNLGALITSAGYYTLEPRVEYESKTATGTTNNLQMLSVPSLSVSPKSVSLTLAADKTTATTLYLSNDGESLLTIDAVTPWESTDAAKVSVTLIPATINGETTNQATVQIDTTGLAEGINEVNLTINSDGGSQVIPFTVTVNNSEPAVLVSDSVELIISTNSTTNGIITLSNTGGIDASEILASILGDLSSVITLDSTPTDILVDANGVISYSVDVTGLAVGTYSDTLRVTYNSTEVQTLDIPITLTVEGAALTVGSASVSGYADDTTKSATVTIENTGTVDLTGIVLTPNDLGSFSASNIVVNPSTIPGLNPGESVTVDIDVIIPSGTSVDTYTGDITLTSNELNDQIDLTVTVQSSGGNGGNGGGGGGGGGGSRTPTPTTQETPEEEPTPVTPTSLTPTRSTTLTPSQEEQTEENLADTESTTSPPQSSSLITGAAIGLFNNNIKSDPFAIFAILFFVVLIGIFVYELVHKGIIKKEKKVLKRLWKKKRLKIFGVLFILAVVIFAISSFVKYENTKYDAFAECLTEKGFEFYGADNKGTSVQKEKLGHSFEKISFVNCVDDLQRCKDEGIVKVPSWKTADEIYDGPKSLEELSEFSGCSIS